MPERAHTHGWTVWRLLTIFNVVSVGIAILLGVLLYDSNRNATDDAHDAITEAREAIAKNRELGCRVGGFLIGTPVVKRPEIPQKVFEAQVENAIKFLRALRELDCDGLGAVTTEEIERQTKKLREALPDQGGGGPSANSPPSTNGGGPRPAPPGPPPEPPPPEPPTRPPPTTTTPDPPDPPPDVRERICRRLPMVCDRLPGGNGP
jgi:hypothetical protein